MEEPVFARDGRLYYKKETRGVLTGSTNTALFRVHDGGTGTGNGVWEQISPILHREGDSVEMWPGSRRKLVHGRPKEE